MASVHNVYVGPYYMVQGGFYCDGREDLIFIEIYEA